MLPGSDGKLKKLAREALTCSRAKALQRLSRLGFEAPERALQTLDRLAGPDGGTHPLPSEVLLEAVNTGRPDRGLHHLERLVEAMGAGASFYSRLKDVPPLRLHLMQVLSHSHFLTDILVRHPQYLSQVLEESEVLNQPMDQNALRRTLRQEVESAGPGGGAPQCPAPRPGARTSASRRR